MNCSVLLALLMAAQWSAEVPKTRQTSSLFVRNWKVCSGFEGANRLRGKSEATTLSPAWVGWRSSKLGVNGNTRKGLVPELSLLESPRFEMLWVPLRLTESWKPSPRSWSMLERTACFL